MSRRQHPWQELADRTGLTFTPAGCRGLYGWPSVQGLYRGRAVRLYAWGDSATDSLREDTKIRVSVDRARDAYFSLSPPMWSMVAKLFPPRERVLVGDAEFDGAFLLRGRPERFVATVFAPPELRQRMLGLRPGAGLMLSGSEIWLQAPRLERDVDCLQLMLDLLCDLAERVEETATRTPLPETMEQGGELNESNRK